ncbi:hypothetical protein BV25DRAFT_1917600 [Artomyces pyxidatus]|uniref:Uncharacterized protein n=1 Tax=Artomyces pyxidatus TaxID=48021 RepID=A0ACB8SX17_9AGAM|nr:hypothetical protein BV25DRAFT_1917600 [Artomyces pyxidatus]
MPGPASPSSGNSSAANSPAPPQTPVSPTNTVQTLALPPSDQPSGPVGSGMLNASNAQTKRKPSRRANTAERRATHNAVERQRRETLNSRFLDLAALLPNLSQIRRPSKSAIVNSSIAHIHSSRRHRAMASREMRLLKLEADALRRELNEWRDRANLPRVEEPVRSDAFSMVLNGEVEVLTAIPGMDDQDEDDGYGDNEDDLPGGAMSGPAGLDDAEDMMAAPFVKSAANPFAHNVASQSHLAQILPRTASHNRPMIAQTLPGVSFENPAMAALYDSHTQLPQQFQQMQYNMGHPLPMDGDKSAWTNQLFAAQQLQQQQLASQHGLFTPPPTSHGSAPATFTTQAYYAGLQRQQAHNMPGAHMYGSPVDDDASSVGSGHNIGRDRSGSMNGSGYGSPSQGRPGSVSSTPGSYEMPGVLSAGLPSAEAFGAAKRTSSGNAMWGRDEMDALASLKPGMGSAPIAVGGGGNGSGFAMMM